MFKKAPFLIVIFSMLFFNACTSTRPDFALSKLETSSFDNLENIEFESRTSQWWKQFDDPMLNQLIDLTLSNNQSLKEAQANVAAAYAVFSDIDTANLPKGSVELDYSRQKQVIPGVANPDINKDRVDIRSYRAGTQLSWSLDIFGKLRYAAKAALANADSQYYLWNDLQVSLTAQVAQIYGQLKGLKARTEVAKKNISSLETMRAITNERFQAGFASQLDLHRIDAQLYGVKATIPDLNAAAQRAHNTLVALLGGKQVLNNIDLFSMDKKLPKLGKPLAIGDPKALLRRRADLRSAERQLASATANVNSSIASLYPNLSISGFLGFLASDSASLGDSNTKAWNIAPSLSWSIFDLPAIQARIDVANAQEQAALARFKQQVLVTLAQAKSSLSDYAQIQKQYHLLFSQTKASSDALGLAKKQYEAGVLDLFELLDIERVLLTAQDNLAQSQVKVFTSIVEVYKAFGGDFDPAIQPSSQLHKATLK